MYRFTLSEILVFSLSASLVLLLASCTPSQPMQQDLTAVDKSHYQLSDNYANHRAQQSFFTSSGGQLGYLDLNPESNAQTIVLLHGVPSSSWLYRKMLPELQLKHRVIAIDLLGYGSSDKPKSENGNYRPASQAGYVKALLNSLGVQNYTLAFHDMGGLVAWSLLSQDVSSQKEAIAGFVAFNTIISQQGFNHPNMKNGMMARTMSKAFANELSSSAALEMTFKNMGLRANVKLSEAECNGYVFPLREGSDEALYEFYTGFNDGFFESLDNQIAQLSEFQGDALVLWGEEDKVLTSHQVQALTAVLDTSQLTQKRYPTNAHFLPEEIPAELANEIVNWLAR